MKKANWFRPNVFDVNSKIHCPLESHDTTDSQPDGETFSASGRTRNPPTHPSSVDLDHVLSVLQNAAEGMQSNPSPSQATSILSVGQVAREGAMSTPANSPTFPYLGIFQDRFASEPPEDLFSKMGAWTLTLQLLVSRTESLSGHLYAARDSDDPFVGETNASVLKACRERGQGEFVWPLVAVKGTRLKQLFHRTDASIINCSWFRIIPESKLQGTQKVLPASLELVSPEGGVKETELILEAARVGNDREDRGRLCRLGG